MATKAVVGRALRETGAALKHSSGLEVRTLRWTLNEASFLMFVIILQSSYIE